MTAPFAARAGRPAGRWLDAKRPYVGLLGVMLGSMMATLATRVTTFGVADLRGSLHSGFDEGAWITTAFGAGQLLSGISCAYFASIVGARRLLMTGIAAFFATSLLAPLSPDLYAFYLAQFIGGLGSGTFIPLTIIFVLRNLPKKFLILGLCVYAMNSEFSQNVAASIEGFYVERFSWHWIFWQYCLALPVMLACIAFGMPKDDLPAERQPVDWTGLVYAYLGFGCLYMALDQGNRLDWTNSGTVNGLLFVGLASLGGFVANELTSRSPAIEIRLLLRTRLVLFLVMLAGFRVIILSTAYIIPAYLQVVQGYRALEIGSVLVWIALPQFVLVLPLAFLLGRIHARWTLGFGTALVALACAMSTALTGQWATADFLPGQVIQAVGQSLALTSLVVLIATSITPKEAVTVGAFIQMCRLFGGEIGIAFMETFLRVREQVHSNLVGLHVQSHQDLTAERLAAYEHLLAPHMTDPAAIAGQATGLLASAVARQAAVLSYIDGFTAAAIVGSGLFVLAAFLTTPRPAVPKS
ncbi:MFS transporter [Aurantimonas sp. 22II-16-19i]|uniref:MFS transporter n=1 Tax=Aurantimonas sp. 22II-16-19i TaxID=1317114 RepID=UPI0009F7D652|nr:MFS transporter [Aurantimonas sp. 22II-16-19i]ORE90364.1 major facilitator superfamily protein [Aurantimonas sp. 22II-16-19i]